MEKDDDLGPSPTSGCWVCGTPSATPLVHRTGCAFAPGPPADGWRIETRQPDGPWVTRAMRDTHSEAEALALELLAVASAARIHGPNRSAIYTREVE